LAAGTLVSNAQTKRANAVTKAYNNQKAANEAYFRTLDERYARKPSGLDPSTYLIGEPATATATATASASENAAASWAAPPFSSVGEQSRGVPARRPVAPVTQLPATARIFGAAPPLPTVAEAPEAVSTLFGTRVNAPAAATTAALRASGVLAPPLLNKNRKRSRRSKRKSSRRQTRRSH